MKHLKTFENFERKYIHEEYPDSIKDLLETHPKLLNNTDIAGLVSIQDGDVEGYIKYLKIVDDNIVAVYDIDELDEELGETINVEREMEVEYMTEDDQKSLHHTLNRICSLRNSKFSGPLRI